MTYSKLFGISWYKTLYTMRCRYGRNVLCVCFFVYDLEEYYYAMNLFKKKIHLSQVQKIALSVLIGVVTGIMMKKNAQPLEYIGTFFLHLIQMVTIPIIFFTIIYGIINIENQQSILRLGKKAIIMFLLTSLVAVLLGIIVATVLEPGKNVNMPVLHNIISPNTSSGANTIKGSGFAKFIVDIIPQNILHAMAEGNILQTIVFSFFVGCILNAKKESCQDLINVCNQSAQVFFEMIRRVMFIAPIGVFGYIASIVGSQGMDIIFVLGKLILTIFLASCLQYLIFGVMISSLVKVSPLPFYKKLLGIQMMAFSTSSSKATLVPLMQVSEDELGISQRSSRFLLPLSAALNMDGGAIYQASCAIFFSQVVGLDLSCSDYVVLILVSTIASIGGAGIPGGVLLFLGTVLQSIGLPVECVVIVASIDRILDMVTTVINVTGDVCVTLLVDWMEGTFDRERYNKD